MKLKVILGVIAFLCLMVPSELAYAENANVNYGNPFENGDFDRSHRYGEFGWQVNGLIATTEGCYDYTKATTPPFEYPSQILEFANHLKASGGTTALGEWGPLNCRLRNVRITQNTREIVLKSDLPTIAHCCQHDNEVPADMRKPITFLVEETKSYWENDGIYHACLVALVGNTIVNGEWDQALIGINYVYADWYVFGGIKLEKRSSITAISNGNTCYTLAGAVYGVYDSEEKAQSHDASQAEKTFTTDSEGSWQSGQDFAPGTWYVSEISPSEGYARDESVYSVEVEAGQVAIVNGSAVFEEPLTNPTTLLLKKHDDEFDASAAQGSASLEGAEFTVRFFSGYYGRNNLPANPTRTWTMRTDEEGVIDLSNPASKVSGDDFFHSSSGAIAWPLGTVSITESKPPKGYKLDASEGGSPKTFIFRIEGSWNDGARIVPDNYSSPMTEYNTPVLPETVIRGDYRIVKEAPVEVSGDDPQGQQRVLVKGIQFQIINSSEHPVTSPVDGTSRVAPGSVVCTITSDENGLASTRASAANGWSKPGGWTGALACGTYTVHEVIPESVSRAFMESHGQKLLPVEDWKITISNDGQYFQPTLVTNKIPQSALRILKLDAETGQRIPSAVSYQIFDAAGKLVTYNRKSPNEEVVDTWTSNDEGELTLPMMLETGTYTIQEVEAPEGYVLSNQRRTFSVDAYNSWDNPVVIEFEDVPAKGKLRIVKTDAGDSSPIAGAEYTVKAAADIVTNDGTVRMQKGDVAVTLVTGEDGSAVTGELYLGSYTVYETKSPEGWALDSSEHTIELKGAGQEVSVAETVAELADVPTRLVIRKIDAKTGEPLPHARFRVWQTGADPVYSYDAQGAIDAVCAAIDAEEMQVDSFQDVLDSLARGSQGDRIDFTIQECNDGVWSTAKAHAVLLEDFSIEISVVRSGGYAAVDGIIEIPAKVEVDSSAKSYELETDDDGVAELSHIPHGSYFVVETNAPEGHFINGTPEVFEFTVNEQGYIGLVGQPFSDTLELIVENEPVSIATTLVYGEEGKRIPSTGKAELVDVVEYHGCVPGHSYTVQGVLHVARPDGEGDVADAGALEGESGRPVTSETTFTAEAQEGTVSVKFEFDAEVAPGLSLVAFEKLFDGESVFAVHEDIDDQAQTVNVEPALSTTLFDADTQSHVACVSEDTHLVDTVQFKGLVPGKEYVLRGTLVDKADKAPILKADGSALTAETTFTAEEVNGEIPVLFCLDTSKLSGGGIVAFETLRDVDGNVIAEHADFDDKEQTVVFPSMGTIARDGNSGTSEVYATSKACIEDTVMFTGLNPEDEYRLVGTMHLVGVDEKGKQEDKGVLNDAEGHPCRSEVVFSPDTEDGVETVPIAFDASKVAGYKAVVFEELYKGDTLVLAHNDIDDESQTVSVPAIRTTAVDAEDRDHVIEPTKLSKVIDTVEFRGLAEGGAYTACGCLVYADSGKPATSWRKEIVAEQMFAADSDNGTIDVSFEFDPADLAGRKVVAFEYVYDERGNLVASHEDLDDDAQSIEVSSLPKGYSKTFDVLAKYWLHFAVMGGILATLAMASSVVLRRSREWKR